MLNMLLAAILVEVVGDISSALGQAWLSVLIFDSRRR